MEIREYYLIIVLIFLSIICIFNISRTEENKSKFLRLKSFKRKLFAPPTITSKDFRISRHKYFMKLKKRTKKRKTRYNRLYITLWGEIINDFFDFKNDKSFETKILEFIIIPFIFTFFFVRLSNIGDNTLSIINNVYNLTLYNLFNKLSANIFLFIFIILFICYLLKRYLLPKISSVTCRNLLDIVINFIYVTFLPLLTIIFLGVLIIEFGNFKDTDIFIPLYYGIVISMIKLCHKIFKGVNGITKGILSILVIILMFIFSSTFQSEYNGGYYFYTTNQKGFNSISRNSDIELSSNLNKMINLTFNDKYKLDNEYTILDQKKDKNKEVKYDQIQKGKKYYLGKYNPESEEFEPTDTKLIFSEDELILQKVNSNELHFVRDGSMRMVKIGYERFVSDISGAKYYNQ